MVKGTPDDWIDAHPSTAELVVEVTISSLETDLEKANIYASAGVPEYWIVRPENEEIDVFRNPADGRYASKETVRANDTLRCRVIDGFTLIPAELFAVKK